MPFLAKFIFPAFSADLIVLLSTVLCRTNTIILVPRKLRGRTSDLVDGPEEEELRTTSLGSFSDAMNVRPQSPTPSWLHLLSIQAGQPEDHKKKKLVADLETANMIYSPPTKRIIPEEKERAHYYLNTKSATIPTKGTSGSTEAEHN